MRQPLRFVPLFLAATIGLVAGGASAEQAAAAASTAAETAAPTDTATESVACPPLHRPICHREAGTEPVTTCIRLRDLRAHLAHGDSSFACGGQPGAQVAVTSAPLCSAGEFATCHRDHTPGGAPAWTTICLGSTVEQDKHLAAGDKRGECPGGPNAIKCADGQLALCHNGRDGIPAELLCVLEEDVKAHLDHGDRYGACDAKPATAKPATATAP